MRINKLTLTNFRGVREGTFEFPRASDRPPGGNGSFNLLVGDNGSGKTSILEGLAVAFSSWIGAVRPEIARTLSGRDAFVEVNESEGRYFYERKWPVRVKATGWFGALGSQFDGEMDWVNEIDFVVHDPDDTPEMEQNSGVRQIQEWRHSHSTTLLPLLSYYSTNRISCRELKNNEERHPFIYSFPVMANTPVNEAELAHKQFQENSGGYSNSVDGVCNPDDLQRWLGFEAYKAFQNGRESLHSRLVRGAIAECIPDVSEVRINPALNSLVFKRDGEWMDLRHLSEGQRNMASMVGDIAWKAAQLNPHLGESALSKTPGIVLVDELELHLHPEWQRLIVRKLQTIFPEIQFICATHSPQIIGEVPTEEIRRLHAMEDHSVSAGRGMDTNRILEEIMGGQSRRQEETALLADLADKINDEDFTAAEGLINNLAARLGENDPEITRARALMQFLQNPV